jgi:hypothetical protein
MGGAVERRSTRILLLAPLLLLAACGSTTVLEPKGPYATPKPPLEVQVINRSCAETGKDATKADLVYVRNQVIRSTATMQRIREDLDNSVPGGNLPTDTKLAAASVAGLNDRITRSTLCEKVRTPLAQRAKALVDAATALRDAGATGGNVSGALAAAQTAYNGLDQELKALGG